jgi:hypothetical protein
MVADAVGFEPVSSLQIRGMQGDFAQMQGSDALNPPKSFLISEAWTEFSLLAEQRDSPSLAARRARLIASGSSQ